MTSFAIENNIENIIHHKTIAIEIQKQNIINRKPTPRVVWRFLPKK
jgi:hypothetical protein